jgi:hypothetical protein
LEHPVSLKPSDRDVLALLRLHPDGLTDLEALQQAGCRRLAARIYDLRAAGYSIISEQVRTPSGKHIARYRLADEAVQLRLPVEAA